MIGYTLAVCVALALVYWMRTGRLHLFLSAAASGPNGYTWEKNG